MSSKTSVALGLDFGTESVRALLVDLRGREYGSAVVRYKHGQITQTLPASGARLPPDFAFQDSEDWIPAAAAAVRRAVRVADLDGSAVLSVGVDFTSCTMLPALRDGRALCAVPRFRKEMFAYPKLWKHHGAKTQTQHINDLARQRREPWLPRYGGIIGLEWFFPKILETLENAPAVYEATEVWLEGGDYLVWQLVGPDIVGADGLARSTCQAGYKAMWNAATGYPSSKFFAALDRRMGNVTTERMPGKLMAPGQAAGGLCPRVARKMGLRSGIPVSAAIIDAHAGVPGAGVGEPDTLVLVMGTSSCHMLNSRVEKFVGGVAGVVEGGILPGYFGYETGQAAVGDAFDWFRKVAGQKDFTALNRAAAEVAPGAEGVLCMDWLNGCRTPLMDGNLAGAFTGLKLGHGPEHLYRALLEASAFGVRWIVDLLREGGVPVKRFVATGGLPHHNPLLVQIYAEVLGTPITVHPSRQGPALGAAILGVLAAGKDVSGFASPQQAMTAMAGSTGRRARAVEPRRAAVNVYEGVYRRYRELAEQIAGERA